MDLATYGYILVIILAISSLVSANYVGISGGEIRHTEIRETSTIGNQPDVNKAEEDH